MAQLRQAEDGHFYILVGPSKGTRQIYDEGIGFLRRNGYPIPNQRKSTHIDWGNYRLLEDKGYLFKYDIPYDRRSDPEPIEATIESIPSGLPLYLQKKQRAPLWMLKIDLSTLSDDRKAWEELQRHPQASITVNTAPSALQQQHLLNTPCLLEVHPETKAYVVQRKDTNGTKHRLQETPETPGLFDNYKGNVFVESRLTLGEQTNLWRRYLPGSTLTFTGTILWLANANQQIDWPGNTRCIGSPESGWQLWQLDAPDTSSITWNEIQKWFSYRSIDIARQYQQIQLITPPEFVADDGWYTCKIGLPLLFQCTQPKQRISSITQQSRLSAIAFNREATRLDRPSEAKSEMFTPSDNASFFIWHPSRSGSYSIHMQGDTTSEPHFIHINSATTSLPHWLYGLSCTATANRTQQTFHAFQDISSGNQSDERNILDQFIQDELPGLMWTSEPEGLPIRITWAVGKGMRDANNSSLIHSSSELTRCWQECIWESISNSNGAEAYITLDAGSFGLIELSLAPVSIQQEDEAWWTDQRLCSQLVWLSRVIVAGLDRERTPIAAPLRQCVRQHCEQVQHIPPLYAALQRIATTNAIPQWVVIRLQALLNEMEQ